MVGFLSCLIFLAPHVHWLTRSQPNSPVQLQEAGFIDLNAVSKTEDSNVDVDVIRMNIPAAPAPLTLHIKTNTQQTMMSPHLILLGPSKSGTSTFGAIFDDFVDIEYYGRESNNEIKYCIHSNILSALVAIDDNRGKNHDSSQQLTPRQLRRWIASQIGSSQCQLGSFLYKWKNRDSSIGKHTMTCKMDYIRKGKGIPNYNVYNTENNSNSEYYTTQLKAFNEYYNGNEKMTTTSKINCWLVEKFVGIVKNVNVPIAFATYLPKLKVFAIIRNPTNRLVSLLHFGKKDKEYAAIDYKIEKSGLTREQHYYRNEFYQDMRMKNGRLSHSSDYTRNHAIDIQCLTFSDKLEDIHSNTNIDGNINSDELMSPEREIARTIFKEPDSNRMMAWMIVWTFIYDKMFGYDNWNQFRMVQFEWFYQNVPRSMGVVKCWLQLNKQIGVTPNNNKNKNKFEITEIDVFKQCPQIYFNNKKYFEKINKRFKTQSKVKRAHANYDTNPLTKTDRNNFNEVFYPCNKALFSLLRQRMSLLLGQWIDWGLNITL